MPRICIYPKDVAQLTGRSYDAAKRLVRRAREAAGKPGPWSPCATSASSPASMKPRFPPP